MSRSTLLMMLAILAVNWGGFIFMLAYGVRRAGRRRGQRPAGD